MPRVDTSGPVSTSDTQPLSNVDTVRVGIGGLRVPDRCVVVKNSFTR